MSKPAAVVIGASSGVGRALAEGLAELGYDLAVAATDMRDLQSMSADLRLRRGIECHSLELDLRDPNLDAARWRDLCMEKLGRVDALFFCAGAILPEDDGLPPDPEIRRLADVNYVGALRLIARFAELFKTQNRGLIVGLSSIAAAAPRRRNMVYASAKAGLEAYLLSLRHYFAGTGVIVQGYALGYVDTAMTFGKKLFPAPVSAQDAAGYILAHRRDDLGIVYFPAYWKWILRALRMLPWSLYKWLNF